jgi:hypothetical protein
VFGGDTRLANPSGVVGTPKMAWVLDQCCANFREHFHALTRQSEKLAIATELWLPRRVLGLPSTFFERPPSRKPSYVTTHGSLGDLHTRLIQKSLAMLPESKIGVGAQLRRQPLPQRLALHRWSAGDLVDVDFPVWRVLLSQRLMVERETPKRSWTSFLGMPRSTAESTFNLRSFEYAFMAPFSCRSTTYASRC